VVVGELDGDIEQWIDEQLDHQFQQQHIKQLDVHVGRVLLFGDDDVNLEQRVDRKLDERSVERERVGAR
jgi:hypothetical protein